MFMRIRDRNSIEKIDKSCKKIAKFSPKDVKGTKNIISNSPRNKRVNSASHNKDRSPSIKTVLSQNKKVSSIRKKEPNKVRALIVDMEKPKIQSPIVRKLKKEKVLPNQSKIPTYFSRLNEKDMAFSNKEDRSK